MSHFNSKTLALALAISVVPSLTYAQADHPVLHVNPRWKECSIQLDPSLTQAAWRQFTQEAGLVAYFRPLTDARPMGRGKFELSALQWQTSIDDHQSAWNDTFVHPDSAHWLTEESGLAFPGLTLRAGVTDRVDVGGYFTKNPQANYGFYGGQVQYNAVRNNARNWGVAARLSFVSLYGPDDVNLTVFGWDLLASKDYTVSRRWLTISPYAGVSSYLSSSHEKSAAVQLADENVGGSQAMIGAVAKVSVLRIGMEYNTAKVHSRSLKVGVAF